MGIHTYDIYKEGVSKQKWEQRICWAVIANLGNNPAILKQVSFAKDAVLKLRM
jgi:isocitrate dehydrogenase